jgi:hypothetical protein
VSQTSSRTLSRTTVEELPYPAGAVVSLAPKTCTFGQLDWRASKATSGEAPQCARRIVTAAARTLYIVVGVCLSRLRRYQLPDFELSFLQRLPK